MLGCLTALCSSPSAFAQEPLGPDGGLSPEDSQLLRELEAGTASDAGSSTGASTTVAQGPGAAAALSNIFNPAMSVNGLLLGSAISRSPGTDSFGGGLQLQELEVQLQSNVDPYFSANLTLAVPSGGSVEVEEGYLAATPQPAGLSLRGGKIKAPFGKENLLHTHAFPFIEKSLIGGQLFGDEGLNQLSVEGSAILPLPWYALLTITAMDLRGQSLFGSPTADTLGGLAALKNVIDLTDDATLEGGVASVMGPDPARRGLNYALGAHLTLKWRPARDAANSSAVVMVEAMAGKRAISPELPSGNDHFISDAGLYAYLQWQLIRGWYLGGRMEYLNAWGVVPEITMRQSLLLIFAPTEFSAFRLQASVTEPPGGPGPLFEGFLQANFTIGAHPAHAY